MTIKKTFVLDEDDAIAVNKALARRQAIRINGESVLPDGESDTAVTGLIMRELFAASTGGNHDTRTPPPPQRRSRHC